MKTLDWIVRGVAILLVILAVFILPRSCGISEKYYKLKAEHDALLINFDKLKQQSADEIAKYEADKAAQDKVIALKNAEIAKKNQHIADLNKTTTELETEYALIQDCPSKVINLQAQVAAWKEKFSVAEGIIADKDAVVFSLTGKYNDQVEITLRYKLLYEDVNKLYLIQVNMNKELQHTIGSDKFLGTVKNVLIVGAVGILGYELLKGK